MGGDGFRHTQDAARSKDRALPVGDGLQAVPGSMRQRVEHGVDAERVAARREADEELVVLPSPLPRIADVGVVRHEDHHLAMCERASLKPGGGNRGGTLGPSRSRPYRCADATAAIASSKSTAPRAFFAGFAAFAFIVLVLLRADDFAPRGELHDRVAEVTGDVAGGHRDLALVGFGKIA